MITRKENFYKILNYFYATLFAFSSVSFTPMQMFMTDGRAGSQHIGAHSQSFLGREERESPTSEKPPLSCIPEQKAASTDQNQTALVSFPRNVATASFIERMH